MLIIQFYIFSTIIVPLALFDELTYAQGTHMNVLMVLFEGKNVFWRSRISLRTKKRLYFC